MRETINGADLRRMIISAAAAIEINKQALNELNVFPVPDGDTGTNMSMTINSAASDLRKTEDPDLEKASKVAASAMLRGARGNSGVILSLLFRGISKRLKGSEECDGVLWAQALQEGVDAAYKAVMKPAEGTILTVARLSAAKAADAARENNFIEFVHEAAIEEAVKALADTVNQNPVLKKAGVVDAGGKGWVVALEAMLSALQGEDVVLPENGAVTQTKQSADFSDFNTEDITFSYCTEFIISRENDHDPENLRAFLSELGDSLVLVDDDEIIKVHVHTNDPGKALTEALNYGSFVTVKIENMRLQHTEKVLSVCTIETGENLFLADTDKAAQQLQQALPYVYSAKIKRKLPGTVQIQVTDAAPAYAVKNKDKTYTLMDDRFKVLEVVQKKPKESILIQKANLKSAKVGQTAQFANKNVAACLTQLAQAIRDYQFTEATAICSEGLNSNSIVYDGRIVFKLGTCEKLEKKIHQGLAACAQLDQDNPSVKGTLRLTGEKQYYFTED